MRPVYELKEVYALTKLGRTTIAREIRLGRLATITVGRRRLVTAGALDRYLALLEDEAK